MTADLAIGGRWMSRELATRLVALALALVGLLGAGRYVWSYWLYRGFAAPSTPAKVVIGSGGHAKTIQVTPTSVVTFTLKTKDLGGFADPVTVVLPPGYSSTTTISYPTLYLLHGQPGEPENYLNIGNVQGVEATLVAEGRMKPMILVLPSGSPGFLDDTEWANGVLPGNDWMTFVAKDLVDTVDSRFRAIPSGRARAIGGFSEGGYGALNISMHNASEFDTVESWSGYMDALDLPDIFGSNPAVLRANSPQDEIASDAKALLAAGTFFWMYNGTQEPTSHRQTLLFSKTLAKYGIAYQYLRPPGTHDWALWRSMIPQSLIAASDHVSNA